MPFVISKLANDNKYPINESHEKNKEAAKQSKILPRVKMLIIKGGSGVMGKNLITPDGVSTEVTQEEVEMLKKNTAFMRQMKRGYLKIMNEKMDATKAASDLEGRDKSDQMVEQDFEPDKEPTTSVKKKKKDTKKKPKSPKSA